MLLSAVTAELNLIWIYNKTITAYSGLAAVLSPLLDEHQAHLAQLRARVIEPAGKNLPGTVTARPALAASPSAALTQLRDSEQAAVGTLMGRLDSASPSLAQLYASIAASEAAHAIVLTARAGQ